jgi:hypothetical protein
MAHALSAPGLWATLPGHVRHGGQAAAGRARAMRTGRAWFWPRSCLKIKKNPFLFFIRFQTEFKLQNFVSKYPELQKL